MLDKRLFGEVRQNKAYMFFVIANGFLSFVTSLLQSLFAATVVNNVFIRHLHFSSQIPILLLLLLVISIRSILQFVLEKKLRIAGLQVKTGLQQKAVSSMLQREQDLINRENAGIKMMAVCEAADTIDSYFYEYIPQLFAVVVSVPLILIAVGIQDLLSFLIMLFTAPLLPLFLALIGMAASKLNTSKLKTLQSLGGSFLDTLNGLRTLKLFGRSKDQSSNIYSVSEAFRKTTMEVLRVSFLSAFVLELAATLSTAVIAVSLGIRLMYGNLQFYEAFFILLLAPEYYLPIRQLGAKFHSSMSGKAAADKIYDLISPDSAPQPVQTEDACGPVSIPNRETEIVFRNVCFSYTKEKLPALTNLNLHIPANKVTALVGQSGSGKSTIAAAILKFIQIDSGELLINGQTIQKISKASLRSLVAYIPQKPFIFHDSIFENIRFSKPQATLDQVREAAKMASAVEFIMRLPEGYDTIVSEEGKSLSRGEAQRLAIARAILKDSPVILMDEITSGLDERNQAYIRKSIAALSKNKTLLLIAHRLETVMDADCIYVLENGTVRESGTHTELMRVGGLYSELVNVWEE